MALLFCIAALTTDKDAVSGNTGQSRVMHAAISPDANTLSWHDSLGLRWSNFQGRPDTGTYVMALAYSSIRYHFHCKNDSLNFRIRAMFFCDSSWVKQEGRTAQALEHEQLHFDLTELYVRKIRRAVSRLAQPCADTTALRALVDRYANEWKRSEEQYDRETLFGNEAEFQAQWKQRIARALDSLAGYAVRHSQQETRKHE